MSEKSKKAETSTKHEYFTMMESHIKKWDVGVVRLGEVPADSGTARMLRLIGLIGAAAAILR